MKIKGINPIEQHFEKGVVGVVGALALAAVALQFLTSPNSVEDSASTPGARKEKLPPNRAYDLVVEDANALKALVTSNSPVFDEPPLPDLVSQWRATQGKVGDASSRLAYSGPVWKLEVQAGTGGIGDAIAPFSVPAPTGITVAQFTNTLDPDQVESREGLSAMAGLKQQPYDATVVSVQASLSVDALKAELQKPGPDGSAPAPAGWWREGLELLAVRLERREQQGEGWGAPTVVQTLPGSFDIVSMMEAEPLNFDGVRSFLSLAAEESAQIRRASYLPSIAGQEWLPPSQAGELADLPAREAEKDRLFDTLDQLDGRIRTLESQVANAASEQTRTQLQRRLDTEKATLEKTKTRLRELGHVFPEDPPVVEEEQTVAKDEKPRLLDNKEVVVWAHDITAKPGSTYQYRLVLELNNPAYGRVAVLAESQRSLAEQLTIESAPSQWSAPVTVDSRRYFFLTGASIGGDLLASESARLDVYEFYYGYWRKGSTAIEPGDIVRASAALPEGLEVFLPVEGGAATPPPSGGGELASGPAGGGQQTARKPEPVGKSREIVIPIQLLDVSRLPDSSSGRDGKGTFAEASGALLRRISQVDRANPIIPHLDASAKIGESQGKPTRQEPTNAAEPVRPVDPRGPETPDPGKGGGGGGGGG